MPAPSRTMRIRCPSRCTPRPPSIEELTIETGDVMPEGSMPRLVARGSEAAERLSDASGGNTTSISANSGSGPDVVNDTWSSAQCLVLSV